MARLYGVSEAISSRILANHRQRSMPRLKAMLPLNPHPVRLACVKISFWLLTPYAQLGKTGYQHIVSFISQLGRTAAEVLPRVRLKLPRVRLKRWIFGTHQGLVSVKCLDLEEFTFRFDRRCARRITHCRAFLGTAAATPPPLSAKRRPPVSQSESPPRRCRLTGHGDPHVWIIPKKPHAGSMNSLSRAKKKERHKIPFSYPWLSNKHHPGFAHKAKSNLNFPMNRRIGIGIGTLVIIISFSAPTITSFAQQNLDMWVSNWREQVFKDTMKPSPAATSIQLVVARNETEASQIVLRETSDFTINSVVSSNLTSGGATLSSSNFTYHFLDYFHADKNSGGSKWCDGTMADPIRRAPADFPEQLSNDTIRQVAANVTQSIWVKYRIPTDTPVGTYAGTITVTTSIGTLRVPVSIEVNPAVLPDPKDGTFTSEIWIFPHTISAVLGPADFSAGWWKIVDDFAKLARETRINSIEGRVSYLVRGSDWTNYDRYIQTFIDAGGLKKITTETMNDSATQYAAQIESHLRSKGWWDMFYMKIIDEPTNVSAYVSLSNSVKAISPSMKIGDPGITNPAGYGTSVNIWQPHITYQGGYDANASAYAPIKQVPGDEVWVYTCCFPTQGQINRLIDNRVFLQELFGWYTFSRDLKGFLHWGLNAWERYPNERQYQFVGSIGDAWSVYPDTAHGTIMSSIRVESAREMSEDHELFRLLEKINPTRAKTIVTSIIRSPSDYEKDINKIQMARDQLVRAASGSDGIP